jgi:hypothetical protein
MRYTSVSGLGSAAPCSRRYRPKNHRGSKKEPPLERTDFAVRVLNGLHGSVHSASRGRS